MLDSGKKFTLLIVDDVVENIDILSKLLEETYELQASTNGELALKIVHSPTPPDLILLDIFMPTMSGYDVCKELKSDKNSANIPIIFITASSDFKDIEYGYSLGAVDYVTKPINPQSLLEKVQKHLLESSG